MREETVERRLSRPRAALAVLAAGLVVAALAPAVATAGPADGGCDVPVLVETTEVEYECGGALEDVTGVDAEGAPEALPPDVDEPDPLVKRYCRRLSSTGPIRAENVDCATARALAARGRGRARTYKALGFTCRGSGLPALRVNCFRPATPIDTGRANDDGGDEIPAAYVLFTRRAGRR